MVSMVAEMDSTRAVPRSIAALLSRALMWPIISLLITGSWHFTVEAIWPDLRNSFVPAVLAPILLAYGAWVGYRAVALGGSYVIAIIAGAILGLLPLMLDVFGFGVIVGRGVEAGLLAGVFGFSIVLFGSLLGGGYAESRRAS